jgi:imidazolonepropionase-like amidohydrolase
MSDLAILGGNVWDGTGASLRPATTVLVADGRIEAVGGDLEVPPGAERIDARGKFVMPGLIDMHVHVQLCGEDSLLAFLGTGVTSVRDLGSDVSTSLPLRDALAAGERMGPRVFVYGPLLDGEPSVLRGALSNLVRPSGDIEAGEAAIEELVAAGVDGIKLYAGLRPELLEAMVRAVGGRVPVTGHLGRTWASEAARAGIDCLEHVHATAYQDVARPEDRHGREDGNGANPQYWRWLCLGWANADLDAPHVGEFIDLLVEREVALSPTTVLITGGWATDEALSEPGQRYRPRFMSERMAEMRQARERAADSRQLPPDLEIPDAVGRRARANQLEFLRRLHAAGGTVLPSTDVGAAPMQVPGFSLHRELALLSEGGIANAEVLGNATREAARVLRHGEEMGTLEAGKLADVLVIDGDPLANIEDTRRVEAVVRGGRVFEPSELLAQIETAEG